jgi:hypothetical protein
MVADLNLLQGKIIEDPDKRAKNISRLIEELALEILSEEDLAIAAGTQTSVAVAAVVGAEGNS